MTVQTGFGQPKAIVFWAGWNPTDDTDLNHARFSFGFCDDQATPNQGYTSLLSEHNRAVSDTYHRAAEDGVVSADSGTGTQILLMSVADRADWPTDGFRISVDTALGSDVRVSYMAFAGGVNVQYDTPTVSSGTEVVSTGWQPDCVIFMGNGRTINATSGAVQSLGFMSYDGTTITNGCIGYSDRDNVTTTQSGVASFNNRCFVSPDTNPALGSEWEGSVTSVSSTSYSLLRDVGTLNATFFALALNFEDGEEAKTAIYSAPTSTGDDTESLGFRPQAALFANVRCTVNNVFQTGGAVAASGFGVGAFSVDVADNLSQRYMDFTSEDNRATSDSHNRTGESVVLRHDNTSAIEHDSNIDSVDSDGFTLNVATAGNSNAYLIPFLAIEEGVFEGSYLQRYEHVVAPSSLLRR